MSTPNSPPTEDLVARLRASAQGVALGAEGMSWGPEDLYDPAADQIESLTTALEAIDSCLEDRGDGRLQVIAGNGAHFWEALLRARRLLKGAS